MSELNTVKSFRYRPDIDGLRTLAVMAVVLFHFGFGVPGGFIGVDIFFVISGYLITSIICKDLEKGTFSMARFWERRIRRIFPVLVVVVTLVCIVGMFLIYPDGMHGFGKEIIAQAALVSNFYFWQQDGYFAGAADSRPLLHTWSLAVEEQFYFVFPIFLVWVHKAKPRRIMKWVGWVLVVSLAWSIYGVYGFPRASFFLLPARGWELLLGSVVALYKFKRGFSPLMNEVMSWVGMALMILPMFFYDKFVAFPGAAALPPCVGAALIIFCNHQKMGLASRLLALPPVVFVGKISYSLYLWHWPLFVYFKYTSVGEMSVSLRLALVVASFVLAVLSWKYVENPFRKASLIPQRKYVFRIFYAISALYIIFGTVVYRGGKSGGWPWRFSEKVAKIAQVSNDPFSVHVLSLKAAKTGKFPMIVERDDSLVKIPVLLWGDSHAHVMTSLFSEMGKEYGMNFYAAVCGAAIPMFDTEDIAHKNMIEVNESLFEMAEKYGIKDVIIVARWNLYVKGDPGGDSRALIPGGEVVAKQIFRGNYKKTLERLKAAGMRVWVVRQVPFQMEHVPHLMANAVRFGRDGKYDFLAMSTTLKQHRHRQQFVDSVIDENKDLVAAVLDPAPYLTYGTEHCQFEYQGKPLYRDDDHLSVYGVSRLKPMFTPMFEAFKKDYIKK